MVRVSPRRVGLEQDAVTIVESGAITAVDLAATANSLRERRHLGSTERCEEVAHPVVEPELLVLVVGGRSSRLVRQVSNTGHGSKSSVTAIPPALVVTILFPAKENTATSPNRARRAAAVRRTERLGGVLDDRDPSSTTRPHDLVVVGTLPIDIDDDHGARRRSIMLAAFEFTLQQVWIDVP